MRHQTGWPSYDVDVPALVLKVGRYVVHHGGLAVTRSLGRVGIPVYGVHEEPLAPGATSRYLEGRFVWKTCGQRTYRGQLLEGMAAVAEQLGRRAVLLPVDDHAAIFAAEEAEYLSSWFLLPAQPPELARALVDKGSLYSTCARLGVPTPAFALPHGLQDALRFAEVVGFPVVVKARESWLLPNGMRAGGTRIVRSRDELRQAVSTAAATRGGERLLLQEHIPGGPGDDWLFHAYLDEDSRCLVAFTGRKLRSHPPGRGETTLGLALANERLSIQAQRFLAGIGYRGVVSLDYRFDPRDGAYKLLDVNPRVGAGFRLFVNRFGVDVVRAMHLHLTGRAVPAGPALEGRVLVVENTHLASCFRTGEVFPAAWWRSLTGADERAWFARDDIRPFVAMCLWSVAAGLRRRAPAGGRGPHSSGVRYLPARRVGATVPGR